MAKALKKDQRKAPSPGFQARSMALWSEFARDRYRDATASVETFRGWARQLAVATGVVITLECSLLVKVVELDKPVNQWLREWSLILFLMAIAVQLWILARLLRPGYEGQAVQAPESPSKLVDHVANEEPDETIRILGAYYAKAYDPTVKLAESIVGRISGLKRYLVVSLALFFLAVLAFALLVLLPVDLGLSLN